MNDRQDAEKSTILATYASRRDAEVARDYLADHDLRTFVSADDAGGMHPQMQRPNGVKLIGMSSAAEEARMLLQEADLAPPAQEHPAADRADPHPSNGWMRSSGLTTAVFIIAILVVVLVLLGIV